MALIANAGAAKLRDYVLLKDAASRLKLKVPTLKRWLKQGNVKGVVWIKDRRGWIHVHKQSMKLVRQFRDKIVLQK